MKNFIEAEEIAKLENLIFVDVRTGDELRSAREIYEESHLVGAFFLDPESDLAGPESYDTGAHPIPSLCDFKASLESIGANSKSHFIIYDDGSNSTAARLWFLLKYFGLENAKIVNGGFDAIKEAGLEITRDLPELKTGHIDLKEKTSLLASYEEVKEHSLTQNKDLQSNKVLVDSRAYERYIGEVEPLYDKAGHIPSAKSYFFGDNYDERGKLKDLKDLENRFSKLKGKDVIVSCGSGVTACSNFIVMDEIGIPARLYNGSYSQWLKLNNPIKVGEE